MITKNKDVRTGQPVWAAYTMGRVGRAALKRDITTDVLVVGAGITGALMAESLTDAGFKVMMVDRQVPLHGSTLATTALLQYEIDTPYTVLSRQIGADKARRAWLRSKLAVDGLAARTKLLGINCDLTPRDTLYLAGNVLDADGLEKERQLQGQLGLHGMLRSRATLRDDYGVHATAALHTAGNWMANPYRLAKGYLDTAIKRGLQIYTPVEITDLQASARVVHVQTGDKKTGEARQITARHVVFTTGYEVPKYLENQDYVINSTWALATKPQKSRLPKDMPMIWEAADPYLYMRTTPDGRIICGGEDAEFANAAHRDALLPAKTAALQRKLAKVLPDIDPTADYAWCGSFGVTPTGLPLIGAIPRLPNCYAVLAFGGNGITNGRIGADLIRNALTGKADADADIYAFTAGKG